MKRIIAAAAAIASVVSAFAQTNPKSYIESLDSKEPYRSAVWGAFAVKMNGDTLLSFNQNRKMMTASTMKLVSTGLGLRYFGADHRYATSIGYSGSIENGILEGDLYIIGGGDPTLFSGDSIAVSKEKIFAQWKAFLEKAGIRKINGKVIGDGRYFDGLYTNGTWQYTDMGTYYGAGGDGLTFYINAWDLKVEPGAKPGDRLKFTEIYPHLPWVRMQDLSKTGEAGTGDNLYLYNTEFSQYSAMRGTFAVDRMPKTESLSNPFGAMTCAYYFDTFLNLGGFHTEGYADIALNGKVRTPDFNLHHQACPQQNLSVIGSTYSPTIKQIAQTTNRRSDNYYAESFMRNIARTMYGSSDYELGSKAYDKLLSELGVDTSYGVRIIDGSGLSEDNLLSPDFFVRYLTAMSKAPEFKDYLYTLGNPGTFSYSSRVPDATAEAKTRIFMKTGSMTGVNTLCGYIMPRSGRPEDMIVFSVMINHSIGYSQNCVVIDKIVAMLSKMN